MIDTFTLSIAELEESLSMEEIWQAVETRMEQVDKEWNRDEELEELGMDWV